MPAKKRESTVKKPVTKTIKVFKQVESGLSIPVFSLDGKESGTLDLPVEVFGAKINTPLLAQAVRVYTTNLKEFSGSTKTRGEVNMTTAKWFRQKGTGRARHGAQSAPIFVGGGIAMGPKPRTVRLDLPKRMKKVALISALSSKVCDKRVLGVKDLLKASGKTKQIAQLMSRISSYVQSDKKKQNHVTALIVTRQKADNLLKAARNIIGLDVQSFSMLNAYDVVKHQLLILDTEAVFTNNRPEGAKK